MDARLPRDGSNGTLSDGRVDQVKRKGSPSDESREREKRLKSSPEQIDSETREDRRKKINNPIRHVDREKRHKSRKHRHADRRSPRSRSNTPHRGRPPRSPLNAALLQDHEAGEIASGATLHEIRDRSQERSRPRSASNGQPRANGRAEQPRAPSRGWTPKKERAERSREPSKRSPMASGLNSSVLEQVRSEALKIQKRKEEQARLLSEEDQEDQLDVSLGRARGKHSPIVWNKGAELEAGSKRQRELSAHEIAQSEVEKFKRQRSEEFSEDAPAAMKASPSHSGSDHGDTLITYRSGSTGNEPAALPARSRWLDNDDDSQDHAAEEERLKAELESKDQQEKLQNQLKSDTEDSEDEGLSDFQKTRPPVFMLHSSRSVHEYERMNKINEGTYGVVHRARDKTSGTICALKQIKMSEEKDGFPLSSIREINILLSLRHKNIVDVSEVVVGRQMDDIYMVMEYMEHDLKALQKSMKNPFTIAEAKNLMKQLLEGVGYLHDNWVLHRDLKTSNILYNNRGQLKICDFGMARQYGSPLLPYTHNVVTLLYRCIELLLGQKEYSTAVDMWSLGCIMAELITGDVLFQGCKELEQIDAIFKIMGTPTQKDWPGLKDLPAYTQIKFPKYKPALRKIMNEACGYNTDFLLSQSGFDLLERLLALDPLKRISAQDALNHPWFKELPLPTHDALMPTFAESKNREGHPRPSQGGAGLKASMEKIFNKK